jgi:hypothetical protein
VTNGSKTTQKAKYTNTNRVDNNTPKYQNEWQTLENVSIEENARSFPK